MAIRKKGSRQIAVDGERYLWRIRKRVTYSQQCEAGGLTIAVQRALQPGRTLLIRTGQAHPKNLLERPFPSVTPKMVERSIQLAIAQGWQPTAKGVPFLLRLNRRRW